MKQLIITIILLAFITVSIPPSQATDPERYKQIISIVIIDDNQENFDMFNKTGKILAKPIPHPQCVIMYGRTGAICAVFGHKMMDDGKCGICLKSLGIIKNVKK